MQASGMSLALVSGQADWQPLLAPLRLAAALVRIGVATSIGPIKFGDDLLAVFGIDALEDFIDLGLKPVGAFLGLRRTDKEQEGEPSDLPEKLQELGLPVLQRVAGHLDQVRTDLRHLTVGRLLF